jgi:hypothetical protein
VSLQSEAELAPHPVFPSVLADISLDLFSLVQLWRVPSVLSPSERGRFFEEMLIDYCLLRGFRLIEQAGSFTLNGFRAASGLRHESDLVIRTADLLVQLELKHLGHQLGKNDLLIFNQKGFDFLSAQSACLREKPLYRMVVSAGALSPSARSFALHWGMVVVEPNRLPLPTLQSMASRDEFGGAETREINDEVPRLIAPLQARASRFANILSGEAALIMPVRIERMLTELQETRGNRYRRNLERIPDGLLAERYREIHPILLRLEHRRVF